jgi:tRNA threonylcarbamoyladenosine biosynthesis protein TsaE
MPAEIRTASPAETKAWGRRLAQLLFPGAVVGLEGELGAGKTCFVKGIAAGLGLDEEEITSPTFTLIVEHYRGRVPLYHIDLYRLEGGEVEELGIDEYLFGQGIAVIEWFRFLPTGTIGEHLLVSLSCCGEEGRILTLTARGQRYEQIVDALLQEKPSAANKD